MTIAAIFAFLHHLAAFTLFAALFLEHLLFKNDMTLADAIRIRRIDAIYGIAAGLVLIIGVLRVIYFEKGAEFYLHSIAFHIKMTFFVITGLLSIYPTKIFIGWREHIKQNNMPEISAVQFKRITMILRAELLCFLIIILAAAMLAKGIGYNP